MMSWPWKRYQRAAEAARRGAAVAETERHRAERRQQAAERQAAQARSKSAALRREIEKNGWTELLQHAWGGH